ncbi:IS1634 family transposase [Thalassomonas viridans]|uniref:IS1634 family transposase n=1 Tax=Thalassomonas viridans TaxID=137584 RepID=A0AAE9YZD1_9GAMM|nr:IS1634 family transposase [Thalassomonas viridans]WDE03230.1 IS1634 family transposase [Thalassomonas viridans]WDE07704.1 IS1634 family transposase [Thalassomonas viridans]
MAFPYTKTLEHLGLVAGFCKEIELANIIDDKLGATNRDVSFGQLFVAMLLNGLGFTGRTLHMYSEYFEDKPLDKLIGPGITPEQLNDDALGRCLDALYDEGVSPLYQKIGEAVIKHLGLPCDSVHLDSTSFHYDGQEKLSEADFNPIQITKGYSRDHRPELNQVILNLICENQSGIPVYMKPASGNSNDMEGFKKIVKSHIQSLKAAQASRYLVADAALYVKDTIAHLGELAQLFITRVPQTLKEAKTLTAQTPMLDFKPICDGYEGVWAESDYGGVAQRWLLIRSEQARKRERHNLDKRILKKADAERKTFKKLCQQEFACEQDAQKAIEHWRQKQVYLDVIAAVNSVPVYGSKGRPAVGQQPQSVHYQITGNLFTPLAKREDALKQLGLFIIATNDLSENLTMDKALSTYKSQQAVEKGFRFLKSPDFFTSAIYLKKPERIESLLMVMTTCLMVYAALEHQIRKQLKAQNRHFLDQKKRPSQKPTARWVFQCFQGVTLLYLEGQPPMVVNWKARQQTIIDCLGCVYRQIYS